mgnify:CR=1 FL=1
MRTVTLFRSVVVLALALAIVPGAASAQKWKDLLNKVTQKSSTSSTSLPASDVAAGLKEELANGTTHDINTLGRQGGFSNNALVRIPLPGALDKIGKLARQMGQGDKVDAFQLSLNRAAEKAVPQVADIFGDAIRKMTLKDAQGILTGGDHAATDYFRRVAGDALARRIEPIVSKATDSVGVTSKYKALTSEAGGSGLGGMLSKLGGHADSSSLDLDKYVTDKTIDGLFTEIGQQEKAIRTNPAARTTELLKKVFGKQ